MNKIFLIFGFIFYSILLKSQLSEVSVHQVDAQNFYVDKLENFYFKKDNSITKTDKKLTKIAIYDSKAFGDISYIDVSNPFITLIFYKNINRILYLDNYFSELRDPILLDDLQLYNVDVVCTSSQGGFWVYDSQNSQVCLVNKDLVKIQQGVNLYSLVESAIATSIVESNNFIFLRFNSGQVIVLDKFGSFYRNIKCNDVDYFDVFNDIIYIITSSGLEIINVQTDNIVKYDLPDIEIDDFKISSDGLIFLSGKKLIKFKIQ